MNEILNFAFLTSMFIFGLHYATLYETAQNGLKPTNREILWWYRYYINKWLPVKIGKPLIGCVVCMAGPYTTLFYWGYIYFHFGFFHPYFIIKWLVLVAVVAGFNRIIRHIAQI